MMPFVREVWDDDADWGLKGTERVVFHANELLDALEEMFPRWHPSPLAEKDMCDALTLVAEKRGEDDLSGAVDAALALVRLIPPDRGRGLGGLAVPPFDAILQAIFAFAGER